MAALALAAAVPLTGLSLGIAPAGALAEGTAPAPAVYLNFDGDTKDSSGNGLDFAAQGSGSLEYITGVSGKALKFTGKSYLKASKALSFGTGDYSFSFWIQDFGTPQFTYVMGNQDYGVGEKYRGTGLMYASADHLYLAMGDGSSAYAKTNQSPTEKNAWVHVAYVVDRDGGIQLYKNGELLETAAIPENKRGETVDSDQIFQIGAGGTSWMENNHFALDEVALYASALSAADVKAAYEKTAYLAQDYACRLDFESNTADSSDNGFDFTGKGTALTYEKGVNGGTAARFTGGSYLQASKTLALGTGDYSFSFWIKDDGTPKFTYILGNQDYGIGEKAKGTGVMYSGLDHMYMALGDGSSPYAKTNQSPVDAGKWTHIVYAVDKDGGIKLYKNGELLETAAIPADKQSASADSGLPFLIGGGNNWHVGANNFALDDVRIYRRALGDKEAQALAYREKAENAGQISFAASAQTIDELRGFVAELQSDLDEPNFADVTWTSSKPDIAMVQTYEAYPQAAAIHGLKAGTAVVTATDSKTGNKAEITVTVKPVTVDESKLQVFFGDLHAHTGVSDGAGDPDNDAWYESRGFDTYWTENRRSTPADAFKHAAEKGNADFLMITDHHYGPHGGGKLSTQDYLDGMAAAEKYTSDDFLAMIGFEASGYFGHMNVFGGTYDQMFTYPAGSADSLDNVVFTKEDHGNAAKEKALWDGMQQFYDVLAASPTLLAQWNHPKDLWNNVWDFDDFGHYSEAVDKVLNTYEIINFLSIQDTKVGHFEEGYIKALDAGWHVSPTGNSDIHQGCWITGYETRTAVLTDELTETKIYDAIRKHRTYATDDSNLLIDYKVNGQVLGSELDGGTNTFHFQIAVSDPDTTVAEDKLKTIEIVSDGGKVVKAFDVNGYSANIDVTLTSATATYFYVRVKDSEEKIKNADYVAYTAPIWTGLTPSEDAAADEAKAAAVSEKIDAIGTVTLDSRDRIAQARAAYDALTDAQKKLVGNYAVLTAAEAAYQALADASDPQPNPGPSPDSSDASEPSGDGGDTPVIPPTGVTLAAGAVVLLASSAAAAVVVRKRKK